MDLIKSIILIGLILSFFFGQLTRINLLNTSFPTVDFFLVLFSIYNLYEHRQKLKIDNKYFLWFIYFSVFTFLINFLINRYPVVKPLFYLIRLFSLLSLLIYPPQISRYFRHLFVLSIIANILFGLVQYLIWPDFTYFNSLNWDPHLSRLVSTFFDPTFTGLIYLLFLIYIFLNKDYFPRFVYYILLITSYVAIALTYSRSTYLSLWIASFFLAKKLKQIKLFYFVTGLLALTIFILPRPPGEGTKLERSSSIKAKIVNYQEGLAVFSKSPLTGHGYNNLFYIRKISNLNSHANSGFDGSLMTVLTTSGVIGLYLWIFGFLKLFNGSNLLKQSLLLAIFIHSLFANSLLYPWTLIFFALI